MTSSSTGAPSGRLATPYTKRQGSWLCQRRLAAVPTQPRAFPSTCSVNRGGVQNLVCLVHRSSFLTIKPDVLQRDNWTKVLATLWYQPAYPVAFDDPRRHSAALQDGPRRRCDRSPIAAGPFRQNIHELQFIDPVLCLPARGRITP